MSNYNLDLFDSDPQKEPVGSAPTFSVSGFVEVVNQTLAGAYPEVYVEGEVSSFKINQGKFVFFDLKDEKSTVGCFMMVFNLKVPLEDGMKVKVKARPKLTDKGRFSLTVTSIQLSGEGSLKRAYELLKGKLQKEGLFDVSRKRMLPKYPEKVGIVASGDSAGYGDFKKIADARWGGVNFRLAHVQVQGESAPEQIIKAIRYFNEERDAVDVIVIIRGGGSLEDLAAFNDEAVARAVAASRIPTLVGVGHEVDVTLAGLAADQRASTPSNAAEVLLPSRQEVLSLLAHRAVELESAFTRLFEDHVKDLYDSMTDKLKGLLDAAEANLATLSRTLKGYNPKQALKRGYSIVRYQGKVLTSGRLVKPGDSLVVELSDAIIDSEVQSVREKK